MGWRVPQFLCIVQNMHRLAQLDHASVSRPSLTQHSSIASSRGSYHLTSLDSSRHDPILTHPTYHFTISCIATSSRPITFYDFIVPLDSIPCVHRLVRQLRSPCSYYIPSFFRFHFSVRRFHFLSHPSNHSFHLHTHLADSLLTSTTL